MVRMPAPAAVGIWNLVVHGAAALKALSPHYMYYFWSVSATAMFNKGYCQQRMELLRSDFGQLQGGAANQWPPCLTPLQLVHPSYAVGL